MTVISSISNMKNNFDVIVVGAGPAGVSAAISCINNGLNVVLVDSKKKEKIGDKVCGEAISKETSHTASDLLQVQYPQGEEINANVKELVLQTTIDDGRPAQIWPKIASECIRERSQITRPNKND